MCPWAGGFNLQNLFYSSEKGVKICTLVHYWKKIKWNDVWEMLSLDTAKTVSFIFESQDKALDMTHKSKCLLNIKWKVGRLRER